MAITTIPVRLLDVPQLHALLWAAEAVSAVPCPEGCTDGVVCAEQVSEDEWLAVQCEWCAMADYLRDAAGYEEEEEADHDTRTVFDRCSYCSHYWGNHLARMSGGEVGCVLAGCDCRWAPPITRPCAHESAEVRTCGTGEFDLLHRKLQELLNIVRGLRSDRNRVMGPDKTVRD
ncbi:hypothetical protein LCGC14_0461440 [marine sediment metagenome]|uniref:Uncharacterized protein n=1 Tax=marine sediment metagenome TaxID=412755 RepID=A0A0F9V1N1_9ZZZZ